MLLSTPFLLAAQTLDHFWINLVGYVGSFLVILAFLLNCMKKLDTASMAYQVLNLVGAAMTLCNAWFFGAMPSATIGLFWMLMSAFFLVQIHRSKASSKNFLSLSQD